LVSDASTSFPSVPNAPTIDSSASTDALAASSYDVAKSVAVMSSPAIPPYVRSRPASRVAAPAASSLPLTNDSTADA
jgi:hypothetical protein